MTSNEKMSVQKEQNTPDPRPQEEGRQIVPAADVYETPEAFVVHLDMPGTTKESISVVLERGELKIRGEVKPYHENTTTLLYSELRPDNFVRVFNIGKGVDTTSVDALYENGVLTLKLLKREEVKPKEIKVR